MTIDELFDALQARERIVWAICAQSEYTPPPEYRKWAVAFLLGEPTPDEELLLPRIIESQPVLALPMFAARALWYHSHYSGDAMDQATSAEAVELLDAMAEREWENAKMFARAAIELSPRRPEHYYRAVEILLGNHPAEKYDERKRS